MVEIEVWLFSQPEASEPAQAAISLLAWATERGSLLPAASEELLCRTARGLIRRGECDARL